MKFNQLILAGNFLKQQSGKFESKQSKCVCYPQPREGRKTSSNTKQKHPRKKCIKQDRKGYFIQSMIICVPNNITKIDKVRIFEMTRINCDGNIMLIYL